MKMAESTGSKSTGSSTTSENDNGVSKEVEKALDTQREVRVRREAEDELLNATTDEGLVAAAERYDEL